MPDIDDLFSDPNAGAYQKQEERTGPPLEYVGEKLRGAVETAHRTYRAIRRDVPDDLPVPERFKGTAYSIRADGLLSPAYSSFRYSLTAFLALYNTLGRLTEQAKISALLDLEEETFSIWLDSVEREGSVTG